MYLTEKDTTKIDTEAVASDIRALAAAEREADTRFEKFDAAVVRAPEVLELLMELAAAAKVPLKALPKLATFAAQSGFAATEAAPAILARLQATLGEAGAVAGHGRAGGGGTHVPLASIAENIAAQRARVAHLAALCKAAA